MCIRKFNLSNLNFAKHKYVPEKYIRVLNFLKTSYVLKNSNLILSGHFCISENLK